jgi:MoxR-like ATPase
MQEYHVTVAGHPHDLPRPFHVLATQNPLEQEGTYPLPEAQLDRFLLHINIGYPDAAAEKRILHLARREAQAEEAAGEAASAGAAEAPRSPSPVLDQARIFAARRAILDMYMSEDVEKYLMELVFATRDPEVYSPELASWLAYGGSPRATLALDRTARAHAWLRGEDFVAPSDVQDVAHDVLRHRIILKYEAAADGITPDRFIDELLGRIPVP